ncbi:putative exported protein [Granulibacter bethesdensis]|uniref:Exported protein n=1 Tax=Granulibacter bethesdensis TaxID=364410 RepID=A0AAC9KG53_9PROT|nr:hypothetical protein [Granulibacter bethesdensis]APH55703.1 putative exported protein [Granulibacter bethesdensis]APH63288.1 putative exported protein [Granulibacter bethesdensis]
MKQLSRLFILALLTLTLFGLTACHTGRFQSQDGRIRGGYVSGGIGPGF